MMWAGWVSFVIGLWLILSSLISGLQGPVNLVIFGILAAVLGFFFLKRWHGIVNGILGIWLIVSGFIPGLLSIANFLIIGIVIVVVSLLHIYSRT